MIEIHQARDRELYYREARAFCHSYSFKNDLEKEVWERHAEGETMRAIAKAVNRSLERIHVRIARVRRTMIEQLNRRSDHYPESDQG